MWCLVGAVIVTVVGWLPVFGWELSSQWPWARVLLRGALLLDYPNTLIGEAVARTGWVTGIAPLLAIHLLTVAFWFGVLYAVVSLWLGIGGRRGQKQSVRA
jgi:hypothetical protein